MKVTNKIIIIILVLSAFAVGSVVGPRLGGTLFKNTTGSEEASKEKKVLYWVALMDANFRHGSGSGL